MAAQLPDIILVNGERMNLYSNPLESFWTYSGKRRPKFLECPNCKRGYVATWELRNGELYLVAIDGMREGWTVFMTRKAKPYTMKSLFPRCRNKALKVVWFSGRLRIPSGKMTRYEHSGYDSRFEREMIVTIEKGSVLRTVTVNCTERRVVVNEPTCAETLQYVVSEVVARTGSSSATEEIFASGTDVVRYLRTVSKNKRLLVGSQELSLSTLQQLLRGRLSFVQVSEESGERKWTIASY